MNNIIFTITSVFFLFRSYQAASVYIVDRKGALCLSVFVCEYVNSMERYNWHIKEKALSAKGKGNSLKV